MAILFIDLDKFKPVNDQYGHAIGDRLLIYVAEQLIQLVGKSGLCVRLGGDEFVILLKTLRDVQTVKDLAQQIQSAFSQPVGLAGHQIQIGSSMGIALFPHDGEDCKSLLDKADIALYFAKEHGRNQYQLYAPSMKKPEAG